MNGIKSWVFGSVVIFTGLLCGCQTPVATGEKARDRLLSAMRPFSQTSYVSMRGTMRASGQAGRRPVVMQLGPDGKFFYRAGDSGYYSDGRVRGRIDFRPSPPRTVVDSESSRPGDVVAVLHRAAGPVPFASAYLAVGGDWLSVFGATGTFTFEERLLDLDRTEILVIGEAQTHRFVFAGKESKPVTYSVHDSNKQDGYLTEFAFESVEFPSSIPDEAFQR